jgi:LysR family pca operon transcriptional activator
MKMTTGIRMRHIRCFLEVAEHGSVTRAAAALNTVQPALSRTLRELEERLGQALFERTAQGLVLTPAGEAFQRHASSGLSQIERGVQQARGLSSRTAVNVGMFPNVARTLVPAAIGKFKEYYPGVDVRLQWATSPVLADQLRGGEIDFLVGRLLPIEQMTGINFEQLYSEPLIFVARSDHELAGEPNLTLTDIDRHLVVVPLPNTIIRRELDKFTIARGLAEFTDKIETVAFDFTRAMLLSSNAVACMPIGSVRRELAEGGLIDLGIRGEELVGSVGLSFVTGRDLSPAAAELTAILREQAQIYV